MKKYTVNVGNIGNIEFTSFKEAEKCYKDYVKDSKNNIGRASGESVVLFAGEDIINEYIGSIAESENED